MESTTRGKATKQVRTGIEFREILARRAVGEAKKELKDFIGPLSPVCLHREITFPQSGFSTAKRELLHAWQLTVSGARRTFSYDGEEKHVPRPKKFTEFIYKKKNYSHSYSYTNTNLRYHLQSSSLPIIYIHLFQLYNFPLDLAKQCCNSSVEIAFQILFFFIYIYI